MIDFEGRDINHYIIGPIFTNKLQPLTSTLKPETRNQKPETRNQKPETRNQKPETRNQKPETPFLNNILFNNTIQKFTS
jgi:hypothetical protein